MPKAQSAEQGHYEYSPSSGAAWPPPSLPVGCLLEAQPALLHLALELEYSRVKAQARPSAASRASGQG